MSPLKHGAHPLPKLTDKPALSEEVWLPGNYPAAVNRVRQELNGTDYERLTRGLLASRRQAENGINYAILGDGDVSRTEALVMFCPFANDVGANMLIRAEFVRRCYADSGLRAGAGQTLPMILFGSPSGGQGLKLGWVAARQVAVDLGGFVRPHLQILAAKGYRRVTLLGFSQGADIALEAALCAPGFNLEVMGLAIGDPAAVTERSLGQLARAFMLENNYLAEDVRAGGLEAAVRVHEMHKTGVAAFVAQQTALLRYIWAITRQGRINLALAHAMSQPRLAAGLISLATKRPDMKVVIGYGTASAIAPSEPLHTALEKVRGQQQPLKIRCIAIQGAHHSWGDNLPLLATFYLEAGRGNAKA